MSADHAAALLVGVALAGCALPTEDEDVDGARAAITDGWHDEGDPHVVALMRGGALVCTGTLIGPATVLTAAHCTDVFVPEEAAFGANPGLPDDRVGITAAEKHPGYDRATLANDIAVLLLAHDVDVTPAALPRSPITEERIGSQARIVGFGIPVAGGETSLRKREGFSRVDRIDHRVFELSGDPSQPCSGDSGGPTFMRMNGGEPVVGVHSGGRSSCTGGSIETRVDAHLGFLEPYLSTPYAAPARAGAVASAGCSTAPVGSGRGGLFGLALWASVIGFLSAVSSHRRSSGRLS